MKPTQLEEDGTRSFAATDDDFLACTFNKFQDERGLLDRSSAYGAAHEVVRKWNHLSPEQANMYLSHRFDQQFDKLDPNKNKFISVDEMYGLVRDLYADRQ